LLTEGTHVREDGAHDQALFETESELEDRLIELCASTHGAVVLFGSAQDLDRLVTTYRAPLRGGAPARRRPLQGQRCRGNAINDRNQGSRH
jgi:hypothetical protein